jgi:hypothetical protein
VDYGTKTLESLSASLDHTATSFCQEMTSSGAWAAAPSQEDSSTLPPQRGEKPEDKAPGLPMPAAIGNHIKELWSWPTVKAPSAARPCRLWKGYFDNFINLTVYPTTKELSLVHLTLDKFKEKLKAAGLKEEYDRARETMKASLTAIRLQAQVMATAQFPFRLARTSDDCMARVAVKSMGQMLRCSLMVTLLRCKRTCAVRPLRPGHSTRSVLRPRMQQHGQFMPRCSSSANWPLQYCLAPIVLSR